MALSEELMVQMYRYMVLGRLFEQRVEQMANKGLVPGSAHLGIGEEASNVGPCMALARRRLYPAQPPRARRGHCQGSRSRQADGRDPGPGNRQLWRAWRIVSLCRRGLQQPGRAGHHWRRIPRCRRRSAHPETPQHGSHRAGLVRRRRLPRGHIPRGTESFRDLEAPGGVGLRQQPICHGHQLYEHHGRGERRGSGLRLRHARRDR